MTWRSYSYEEVLAWPKVPRFSPLPQGGGCYAIYGDGRLIYIGCTQNLAERVLSHVHMMGMRESPHYRLVGDRRVKIRRWSIKVRPARFFAEWATLELRLIRRIRPPMNKWGVRQRLLRPEMEITERQRRRRRADESRSSANESTRVGT